MFNNCIRQSTTIQQLLFLRAVPLKERVYAETDIEIWRAKTRISTESYRTIKERCLLRPNTLVFKGRYDSDSWLYPLCCFKLRDIILLQGTPECAS